ncbi:hypothetical protein AX15_007943 [Amanita polypyramis BW_CC]|nr:hypothetical protein AX15_007943 [Amanita polypyramis BW_CC]
MSALLVAAAAGIATLPWLMFQRTQLHQQPTLKTFVWAVVLVHTLYLLYLFRTPPPNVFTALQIPINAPVDAIRSQILQRLPVTGSGRLPEHINRLLDRLSSPEMRGLYVRFGHNVVTTCEHCQTADDYVLYALPRPTLSYLREIALVGLVTLEKLNRSHLRPLGIGILIAAFVTEAYWLGTTPISIPSATVRVRTEDAYMWHDQLLLYRHFLFLVLPIFLSILPSILTHLAHYPSLTRIPIASTFIKHPLPLSSLNTLGLQPHAAHNMQPTRLRSLYIQSSLKTLEHLLHSVHLGRFTQAAAMRDLELRTRAGEWWAGQKEEADVILNDEGVKRVARAEGLAFDEGVEGESSGHEGPLKVKAKAIVDELFRRGVVPSEHWVTPRP